MNEHTLATRLAHLEAMYATQHGHEPIGRIIIGASLSKAGSLDCTATMCGRNLDDFLCGHGESFEAALMALEYKLKEMAE